MVSDNIYKTIVMLTNALRSAATRSKVFASRRFSTDTKNAVAFLKQEGNDSFKKNWLMDKGAYPIIVILGFACSFCAWCGVTCLAKNPDVQISPGKRNKVVRDWAYVRYEILEFVIQMYKTLFRKIHMFEFG